MEIDVSELRESLQLIDRLGVAATQLSMSWEGASAATAVLLQTTFPEEMGNFDELVANINSWHMEFRIAVANLARAEKEVEDPSKFAMVYQRGGIVESVIVDGKSVLFDTKHAYEQGVDG